jgi:hypothetical protein
MSTADGAVLGATQIAGSAPRNRAFNVVLLGDGFTAGEQGTFDGACSSFVAAFLAAPPFDGLLSALNVFRINVASTDSGADDPVAAGGTGATARTYFDSTFGANGIRRLLVCNNTTAFQVAAAHVPEFTVVLVVVNSNVHGGSGGALGTYSLAPGAEEIAIHEMGHTAFGLADEYPYYAGGDEPGQAHHPPGEPSEPNVTTTSDRNALKWRWAVAPATAIPTMTNPDCSQVDGRASPVPAGTVGLFEGAHYYHCGAYRPEWECKMRSLGVPFCRVCSQAIRNRIGPLSALSARPRTPIAAVARSPGHLDVFAVASDGRTMTNWWAQGSGWAGWTHISGGVASGGGRGSPVTAVARSPGRLEVFTVGTNDRVHTASWTAAGGWSPWFPIGDLRCRPGSTVSAVARGSDNLHLFTTASDGRVMSTSRDAAAGWAPWLRIGNVVAAAGATVTAVARDPSRLDVFTIGTDRRVRTASWAQASGWGPWSRRGTLECRSGSIVAVVARRPDRLDLFTTASDGRIMSTSWQPGSGWRSWFQVSGGVAAAGSSVTALARRPDRLDVFVVGAGGRVRTASWREGQGWAPWTSVAGGVGKAGGHVAAVARTAQRIDVFTVGADDAVATAAWTPATGWQPWSRLAVT